MGDILPDYPTVCANQCPENQLPREETRVEVYEADSLFHYQAREVGVKNSKANSTLCGLPVLDMRKAAWFDVGDRRGKVHFDRACEVCRGRLVF